jgi:hypothetical protein
MASLSKVTKTKRNHKRQKLAAARIKKAAKVLRSTAKKEGVIVVA